MKFLVRLDHDEVENLIAGALLPNICKHFQGWKSNKILHFVIFHAVKTVKEAFQTKKRGNLGNGPNRGGGRQKSKKSPKFQFGKVQNNDSFSSYMDPEI